MELLDGVRLDRATSRPVRQVVAAADHAAEGLLRRAQYLDPADQLLLTCALKTGLSQRRIAELLNQPNARISRRLKHLQKLLAEPHIIQLIDGPCPLTPEDREFAIGLFLQGLQNKQLGRRFDMNAHQVARRVAYFKGWMKGINGRR